MEARIGIDIGGTFTDFVSVDSLTGEVVHTKSMSDPDRTVESSTESLSRLGISKDEVQMLIHGTTIVANLIIERTGARVGLITTAGFRDVLEIGWSYRRDTFNLQWTKPASFVPRSLALEVNERIGPSGDVRVDLDREATREAVKTLRAHGVEVIVISFLHSYANRLHEEMAREIVLKEAPDLPCIISAEVDPQLGEYERVSTAVLNGYAAPAVGRYIDRIEGWLPDNTDAIFMQSEGGVAPAPYVKSRPISLVASGPTAGVLAANYVGEITRMRNLISFDVGGTSADVCVIRDGHPSLRDEVEVEEGIPIRTQCVDVVSIGAAGGSIAWKDEGGALRVGPQSAGANPGPACYGLGGHHPTLTDANVILGIIDPTRLLGGRLRGNIGPARRSIAQLASEFGMSAEEAALGIYRIANANMAQAIRTITVEKGIDPRDFTLVAFGGAGGQNAIEVAREMQISSVLFPIHPSTFSALGLLTADLQVTRFRPAVKILTDILDEEARAEYDLLREEVGRILELKGVGVDATGDRPRVFRKFAHLRYSGQIHSLRVPIESWDHESIARQFEEIHERLYGTRLGDPIEVVSLSLTGIVALPKPQLNPRDRYEDTGDPPLVGGAHLYTENGEIPVLRRESLSADVEVPAPCLVEEEDSVIYLPSGVNSTVDEWGNIVTEIK